MHIDAKILNEMLANHFQHYIKRITQHNQVEVILQIHG